MIEKAENKKILKISNLMESWDTLMVGSSSREHINKIKNLFLNLNKEDITENNGIILLKGVTKIKNDDMSAANLIKIHIELTKFFCENGIKIYPNYIKDYYESIIRWGDGDSNVNKEGRNKNLINFLNLVLDNDKEKILNLKLFGSGSSILTLLIMRDDNEIISDNILIMKRLINDYKIDINAEHICGFNFLASLLIGVNDKSVQDNVINYIKEIKNNGINLMLDPVTRNVNGCLESTIPLIIALNYDNLAAVKYIISNGFDYYDDIFYKTVGNTHEEYKLIDVVKEYNNPSSREVFLNIKQKEKEILDNINIEIRNRRNNKIKI